MQVELLCFFGSSSMLFVFSSNHLIVRYCHFAIQSESIFKLTEQTAHWNRTRTFGEREEGKMFQLARVLCGRTVTRACMHCTLSGRPRPFPWSPSQIKLSHSSRPVKKKKRCLENTQHVRIESPNTVTGPHPQIMSQLSSRWPQACDESVAVERSCRSRRPHRF